MVDKRVSLLLLEIEKIIPILNKIAIFGGLNDKQLYSIFKHLRKTSYKANEYIFKQGDEPTDIYIIMSGEVKIIVDAEGTSLELIALGEGRSFGETAVIAVQPQSASALAVKDSELIVFPRSAINSIFKSDKELFGMLMLNIAREACRRLHNADEVLLHYFCKE